MFADFAVLAIEGSLALGGGAFALNAEGALWAFAVNGAGFAAIFSADFSIGAVLVFSAVAGGTFSLNAEEALFAFGIGVAVGAGVIFADLSGAAVAIVQAASAFQLCGIADLSGAAVAVFSAASGAAFGFADLSRFAFGVIFTGGTSVIFADFSIGAVLIFSAFSGGALSLNAEFTGAAFSIDGAGLAGAIAANFSFFTVRIFRTSDALVVRGVADWFFSLAVLIFAATVGA